MRSMQREQMGTHTDQGIKVAGDEAKATAEAEEGGGATTEACRGIGASLPTGCCGHHLRLPAARFVASWGDGWWIEGG